jgi:GntR family transcriptional regulator, vanillate catabolism transcriptional regulator
MKEAPLMNRIRQMILSGELKPGGRVTEAGLAAVLGVSRTPIRNILPRLASEGFLEPAGKRGFAVKAFSEDEGWEALELRAFLEGLAARRVAQNGASAEVMQHLELCLNEGDRLFDKRRLEPEDEIAYGEMNVRFHRIIIEAAHAPLLASFIQRLNLLPFIAPEVIVFDQTGLQRAYELLFLAHGCHHAIVEAIRERDSARAEALFREHGQQQRQSVFAHRQKLRAKPVHEKPAAPAFGARARRGA